MQIHVEVVTRGKRGRERIATIERDANVSGTDGIGLTLDEVKSLTERLQSVVAAEQVQEVISANSACTACGRELPRKGSASIVYRTAFGKLRLSTPRLYSQCRCGARARASDSFNPLGTLLEERTHPELLYLQTRWASVLSYERTAKLLEDVLPIEAVPGHSSIKAQVRKVGAQLAAHEYQAGEHYFDGHPLRLPDTPQEHASHVMELDAAYVRAVPQRCDGRKSFGIVTTRLIKRDAAAGWNANVIEETMSPLKRLHHYLHRQGVELDTPVAIIRDGGEDVAYPTYLPWRPVQRILGWFHISMRFEHVLQRLRGLRKSEPEQADAMLVCVASAKWRLWHGRAAASSERLTSVLPQATDALKSRVSELIGYLDNPDRLTHYAVRYRSGLPISTSTAESAVESVIGDRFKKNRKMRWTTKGANALLHIRVANLNGELADALKRRHSMSTKPANESSFYFLAA